MITVWGVGEDTVLQYSSLSLSGETREAAALGKMNNGVAHKSRRAGGKSIR